MARYDIYKNPDTQEAKIFPFFLDVQNNYIDIPETIVVIPLRYSESMPYPVKDLNPLLSVKGNSYRLDTAAISAVPRRMLKASVANIASQQLDIQNALDALLGGY